MLRKISKFIGDVWMDAMQVSRLISVKGGLKQIIATSSYILVQRIGQPRRKDYQIITRNGYKMFLIPKDRGISAELRVFKIHEPLTTSLLINELKSGMVCVDIGSNIGYYTILASKLVGEKGKVVSVEPIRLNFDTLMKNIKINNLRNVIPINAAISDVKGTVEMIVGSSSNWCRVSKENRRIFLSSSLLRYEEVPAITCDNLLKYVKNVDFIRMDVEGFEYNIINSRGCKKIIERYSPTFLVEFHPLLMGKSHYRELLDVMYLCVTVIT
jgi:FkbM family methyltransferase